MYWEIVWQLIHDNQTLAAGILAVLAAVVGAWALVRQANTQRELAEAAARRHTKAAIAALIAEVQAMKQHLQKLKNGAVALAQEGWEQHPEYISRQFYTVVPDIFKYYYRDSVVIPVRTAARIFDVVKQLMEINGLVGVSALMDVTQRQDYPEDIGDQIGKLYDRVIAVLDDLGRELEDEYSLYIP